MVINNNKIKHKSNLQLFDQFMFDFFPDLDIESGSSFDGVPDLSLKRIRPYKACKTNINNFEFKG